MADEEIAKLSPVPESVKGRGTSYAFVSMSLSNANDRILIEKDIIRIYDFESTDAPSKRDDGNFVIGEKVEIIKPGSRFNDKNMQEEINEGISDGSKYQWDEKPLRANQYGTVVNHTSHSIRKDITVHVINLHGVKTVSNLHVLIHPDGLTQSLWKGQLIFVCREGAKYTPSEGFSDLLPWIPDCQWIPPTKSIQNKHGRIVSILRHHSLNSDVYLVRLELSDSPTTKYAILKSHGLRDYAQMPSYLKPKKQLFEFKKKASEQETPSKFRNVENPIPGGLAIRVPQLPPRAAITLGTLPHPPKGRGSPMAVRPPVLADKPKPLQVGAVRPLATPHPTRYSASASREPPAIPITKIPMKIPAGVGRGTNLSNPTHTAAGKGGKGRGMPLPLPLPQPVKVPPKGLGGKPMPIPIPRRPYEGEENEDIKRPKIIHSASHSQEPTSTPRPASDAYRKYASAQSNGKGGGKGGGKKGGGKKGVPTEAPVDRYDKQYPTNYNEQQSYQNKPHVSQQAHGGYQSNEGYYQSGNNGAAPQVASQGYQQPQAGPPQQPPGSYYQGSQQVAPYQQYPASYQQPYNVATQPVQQSYGQPPTLQQPAPQQYPPYAGGYAQQPLQQTPQQHPSTAYENQSQQYQQYLQSYGYATGYGAQQQPAPSPTAAPPAAAPVAAPVAAAAPAAAPTEKYKQLWEEYKQQTGN